MSWDQFQNLVSRMLMDSENGFKNPEKREQHVKFLLLIAIGSYAGLRIGDILNLKWSDILQKESLEIVEEKRKKKRAITLNPNLIKIINKCYMLINPDTRSNIFTNNSEDRGVFTIQYVNRKLNVNRQQNVD